MNDRRLTTVILTMLVAVLGISAGKATKPPRQGKKIETYAGDVRNLSGSAQFDGEPFVAVNPVNPQNIVAGWMSFESPAVSIKTRMSSDGGDTWSAPVKLPHTRADWNSADVSAAFDRLGNVYLAYADYQRTFAQGTVLTVKSTDSGRTWSTPRPVSTIADLPDRAFDRPWLAVDGSGGPFDGTLYVTGMSVYTHPGERRVHLHRSGDGGATWSTSRLDDAAYPVGRYLSHGYPVVGAGGRLSVVFLSDRGCGAGPLDACLILASSDDGGKTLSRRVVTSLVQPGGLVGFRQYSLAASPTRPGDLAVAWTDGRTGDGDILFKRSSDDGRTWSDVVRVNNDPEKTGVQQDLPWVGILDSGAAAVAWRDRRQANGGFGSAFDVYLATMTPGSTRFGSNIRLTPSSSPHPETTIGTTDCCNSFLALAAGHDRVFVVWSDFGAGNWDIRFGSRIVPILSGLP